MDPAFRKDYLIKGHLVRPEDRSASRDLESLTLRIDPKKFLSSFHDESFSP
jgi:hypothetical protein